MAKRGLMIVLEGSDGSGKSTQFNLLAERLKAAGYDVEKFDFPQYDKESSYFVRQYLSGAFGPAANISPYTASLFYALDRYEAAKSITKALNEGKIVLTDRYAGANMAYQGAKFTDPVEQRGFFVWADNLEFQLLGIPRPKVNLFLRVPPEISAGLIDSRGQARDEHEKNSDLLKKSVDTYDLLCRLFPKDFTAIECTEQGKLLSIPKVSNLIWEKIKPLLPPEPPHNGHAAVVTLGSEETQSKPTAAQTTGDKLIHQFKNSSFLLKLAIEQQIASVEPAGFSVWSDNKYKFYTPMGMPKPTETEYKSVMNNLRELHSQMRQRLEKYYERTLLVNDSQPRPNISAILLPATPVAALCDFEVAVSLRTAARLAASLLANDSPELQWAARQLYLAARQVWPQDFKQPLEAAGNPEPLNNIITKLAEDKLTLNSGDREPVKLLEAAPRQEFDLLADSIYPYSSLSLDEISEEVSNWSYQQKYDSLKTAVLEPVVLEKIRYKFDVISDQLTLAEAINTVPLRNVQAQIPSPRLGYDVPSIVEEAGIDELYLECFDASLKLFSVLQQAEREDSAVYGTLLGHKLRWQFESNASELKNLIDQPGSEGRLRLAGSIKEAICEVHPLTWDVLGGQAQPPQTKLRHNRVKPAKRRHSKSKRPSRLDDK